VLAGIADGRADCLCDLSCAFSIPVSVSVVAVNFERKQHPVVHIPKYACDLEISVFSSNAVPAEFAVNVAISAVNFSFLLT